MTRRMVPALALILGAVVATTSCSGPASHQSAGSRSGTTSASPAATHFQRLDYSLAVPEGWRSQEGYLDGASVGGPPRVGAPTFVDFVAPGSDPRILVGERAVPDAAPLDQWIGQMRTAQAITHPAGDCNPAEEQVPATLGGEPAQMVAFHCPTDGPRAAIVQLLARHADTGWVVSCFSGSGVSGGLHGLEQQCGQWVHSFRFGS